MPRRRDRPGDPRGLDRPFELDPVPLLIAPAEGDALEAGLVQRARLLELILGLPPMNQIDATATPLFACFTATPNFAPFKAVLNTVPLDEMNPDPKALKDPVLRRDALASAKLPLCLDRPALSISSTCFFC